MRTLAEKREYDRMYRQYRVRSEEYREAQREYNRQWRAKQNPNYKPRGQSPLRTKAEAQRQLRATNPAYNQRQNEYSYKQYWKDELHLEQRRKQMRQQKAEVYYSAKIVRQNLRSIMSMDPRIARLVSSLIDLESASDAEVRRFYLSMRKGWSS